MRLHAILLAALLVAACYGGVPGPAPGEMVDLVAALAARGLSLDQATAGDPGCDASPLYRDAVRLDMTYAADGKTYVAYLFRWRNQAAHEAAVPGFVDCAAAHVARTGVDIDDVGAGLWRAYGPDWSPDVADALEDALNSVAG